MRRYAMAMLFVVGLVASVAGAAKAESWPDWSEVTGSFPCTVQATLTSTGWDYVVNVDPESEYPGWAIRSVVIYASNIPTQKFNGWGEYQGGSTVGWSRNGGWELNKFPGPSGTTAAFGWATWGSDYLYSGSSATFHAINLPAGFERWNQSFAVRVQPSATGMGARCDPSFWASADGGPPQHAPEPGTLALLTVGAGAVWGGLRRRKTW